MHAGVGWWSTWHVTLISGLPNHAHYDLSFQSPANTYLVPSPLVFMDDVQVRTQPHAHNLTSQMFWIWGIPLGEQNRSGVIKDLTGSNRCSPGNKVVPPTHPRNANCTCALRWTGMAAVAVARVTGRRFFPHLFNQFRAGAYKQNLQTRRQLHFTRYLLGGRFSFFIALVSQLRDHSWSVVCLLRSPKSQHFRYRQKLMRACVMNHDSRNELLKF